MKQGVLSELDSETARAVADEHSRAGVNVAIDRPTLR